ncbi:putative bifunctional diguanylate cyclase/phosphodiesterase [Methylobacterium oryzisoli]|uniref:putative bifunctional diguanylate cyclase/phosphodiesterase n=1 Tax=Methylobacterium oryzisoli TaxID=3385502 RepID=UPI003892BA20
MLTRAAHGAGPGSGGEDPAGALLGEAGFHAIAEQLPEMMALVRDDDGRLVYANRRFHDFFGPVAWGGRALRQRVHPDDLARLRAGWGAAQTGGERIQVEARLRRRDASHCWHRISFGPIRLADGAAACLATALDIDDIVVERDRFAQTTDLLQLAQEAIGAAIWDWDRASGAMRHSPESARLIGLTGPCDPDGAVRIPPQDILAHIHPEDAAGVLAAYERAVATRTTFTCEYRAAHAGSEGEGPRWLQCFGRLVFGPAQDQPVRVVGLHIDVSQRKAAEERIARLARHDPLTDLPNRTMFRERLDQTLAEVRRTESCIAVLCLDLDRFKAVNDTLGHPVGDALLQAVAARLRTVLRREDTVARLGGDEFAVIQTGADPRGARVLCERLIEALSAPVAIGEHRITVGLSIGLALAPADGTDADTLFKRADLALYRAKAEGRGTFRFYEAAMDEAAEARRRLELDLGAALARDEIEVHYQPVAATCGGRILGFEALMRWRHPTRGLVSPGCFIPLAEETGLIVPLGEALLRQACRTAKAWPDPDLKVSVNVSAVQFQGEGLLASVAAALAASGLPARRLELEITETLLLQDCAAVLRLLQGLRTLGVRIVLDDFGIGYSSLSYLRQFPFDKIKIDRSFVEDAQSPVTAAIIRSVVGLGGELGMAICAEGVETEEQRAAMAQAGCGEIQGYLISPPLPGAQAAALAAKGWLTRAA